MHEPTKLPAVAWAFALSCLVGQLIVLAHHGRDESNQLVGSMLLGAVVIGWFAWGVLRAKTVRMILVWTLYSIATLGQTIDVVDNPAGWDLANWAVTVVQFGLFIAFTRTAYYRWQASRPTAKGPSLAGLVAIAVLVGGLGGVVGAQDNGFHVKVGNADD